MWYNLGHEVIDYGTNTIDSVDYPEYAFKVGNALKEEVELGILIWGTVLFASQVGAFVDNDSVTEIVKNFGFIASVPALKDLLIAISRKTGIEINIENLEAQLKEDEFEREEKEGKNR